MPVNKRQIVHILGPRDVPCPVYSVKVVGSFLGTARFMSLT